MKILSDAQLYPSSKPLFSGPSSSTLFPSFPIITQPNFLPQNETEEAAEMTNTKSNNDPNVPSHREAMNQILKKLALKSQENLKKSKDESGR